MLLELPCLKNNYYTNVGARIPRPIASITDAGGENPPPRCCRTNFQKTVSVPRLWQFIGSSGHGVFGVRSNVRRLEAKHDIAFGNARLF
jgi:hypothetical protein